MHLSRLTHGAPYVCAACIRRCSNSTPTYFGTNPFYRSPRAFSVVVGHDPKSSPSINPPLHKRPNPSLRCVHTTHTTNAPRKPLRIAIIGSGPAGFYTVHRLMHKLQDAVVDMYEQLPVPYGLVRFGVAPDHPEVKNCQDTFEEVAASPRFTYIGNVRVGYDLALAKMKPHYDAILFSYGASEDRKLGIPGEDLPGVFSAREFVGWYNALPQFQNLEPELGAGEQAVIIGQGNVALDVARILLTPVDVLRKTDITEEALDFLSRSRVKSVNVVGRRGPLQAAFTVKEARELMHIPDVAFEPIDPSLYPPEIKKLPRVQRRIAEVLLKGTQASSPAWDKTWALAFLKAPQSMNPADSGHLASITFTNQTFCADADPFSRSASVMPTKETTVYPASLAFRSVGYKSAALPGFADIGVPFDSRLGIIPNDPYGRIVTPSCSPRNLAAAHIPGLYCAGWVKRGPTGVIASTMQDAFTSADVVAQDWGSNVPFLNTEQGQDQTTNLGWEGVKEEVLRKGVRPVSWEDWKKIDEAERVRGKELGKKREKLRSVDDMLGILN